MRPILFLNWRLYYSWSLVLADKCRCDNLLELVVASFSHFGVILFIRVLRLDALEYNADFFSWSINDSLGKTGLWIGIGLVELLNLSGLIADIYFGAAAHILESLWHFIQLQICRRFVFWHLLMLSRYSVIDTHLNIFELDLIFLGFHGLELERLERVAGRYMKTAIVWDKNSEQERARWIAQDTRRKSATHRGQ